MRALTKEDARELLRGQPVDTFVSTLQDQLRGLAGPFATPPDSGVKTDLSRDLVRLLLGEERVSLYISGWSIWPSAEHLDLFYGYRRSLGETRLLIEAPVHVFEPSEQDQLVSVLCLVFYFVWDAWAFDLRGRALLRISHDEWFEARSDDDALLRRIAAELEEAEVHLLETRGGE